MQPEHPGNYPPAIGSIFLNKCATSGCHNQLSYFNAAGLNLSTWSDLFKGAASGSTVIPYRPDFSSLCYFINVDSTLGISLQPAMPLNQPPLTREEYLEISRWIADGAPDASGNIWPMENHQRRKIYVGNRMCDEVTVFDAETLLPMRYITVGVKNTSEYPYCIKVSPDRDHWYVGFYAPSGIVQKYDAATDELAGTLNLGEGLWHSFAIMADSRYGYFVDNSDPGKIVYADLQQMKVIAAYDFNNSFHYPNGIAVNEQLKKIYVGTASGNFVYRIDVADPLHPHISELTIDGSATVQYHSSLDPVDLLVDPQRNLCYIACGKGEIRVVDMKSDALLAVIPLGARPGFMAFSEADNKLFVTSPGDTSSFPGHRGTVKVVDVNSYTFHTIKSGYEPFGLAVEKQGRVVAVANANINSGGPSSHHVSRCGAKNGNVSFIDLNTLQLIPGKTAEVAVFPFGVATR